MKLSSRLPIRLTAIAAAAAGLLATTAAPASAFPGAPRDVTFVRVSTTQVDLTFVDTAAGEIEFQIEYKQLATTGWRVERTLRDTRPGQPQATGMTVRVNNLTHISVGGCYRVWAVGHGGRLGSPQKCTAQVSRTAKMAKLSSWTQTPADSYNAWYHGWRNQPLLEEFGFDWTTDLCSSSPDQPAGFDFRMPCRRHDFGYRNYRELDAFAANKARLDDAFLADLYRRCDTYSSYLQPVCDSIAWIYHEAVVIFGFTSVDSSEVDRHVRWRAQVEAAANARRP
jgi:hypothetical protein